MDELLLQNPQSKAVTFHRRPNLKFEECTIGTERIKLPQALCENSELYQELLSVDSWNAFTEQQRRHLMQLLPNFGENDTEEKSYTLKMLFSGSQFRFGSNPLVEFGENLTAGYYHSEIVKIKKMLTRARYKEYLKRQRLHYYKVLKHSLVTRHKLLELAKDLPMDSTLPAAPASHSVAAIKRKIDSASLERRVKHRYYQELISIKKKTGDSSDSSFDENYPEGFIPPPFTKKHRKQICQLEESFNAVFDQPVISTLSRPDCLDLSRLVLNVNNPFDMTEDKYKEMLKRFNKNRKDLHPHLRVVNISDQEKLVICSSKVVKENKPIRKRRARRTTAAIKAAASQKTESAMNAEVTVKTTATVEDISERVTSKVLPLNDGFSKSLNTFKFPVINIKGKSENTIKEQLDTIRDCKDTKSSDFVLEKQEMILKEELAMREEQDQAVAALLKQERDIEVNEFIKRENKSSVLLFEEFDQHIKEEEVKNPTSKYLLLPQSYNVDLQSVITSSSPSFKKTLPEVEKSTPSVQAVPSIISETERLHFNPLSIDTIAEIPFTNSTPVITGTAISGNATTISTISPSVTDLDSMNVMDLGPLNAEDTEPPPSREKPPGELMHNAHSSFFSLIREIVCSTWDHRMDLQNLQKRIDTWYDNAVSPLNSWYTNQTWPNLLQNALTFLAGQCPEDLLPPEYVPYIEYKSNLDIYQWIGAGRDSDTKLSILCDTWLKNKDDVAARVVDDESILPFVLHEDFEFKREQRATSPAASRYPTDWQVQPSTSGEKEHFQTQEKLRFQNPNIPFVYHTHGYQTVVGPVNMNYAIPNSNKISKGSSLLSDIRPYYVTILALVQDACARLPNGEGTRHDIITLLKDSQYLSQNIINCVLHGAVTSSLERLQLESDPCIKYDARRKIWIYLHRSRTINDFEIMETVKPKAVRKPAAWKLRRDYIPGTNSQTSKADNVTNRAIKETKLNVRSVKNIVAPKFGSDGKEGTGVGATDLRNTTSKSDDNANQLIQPAVIKTVVQVANINQGVKTMSKEPRMISIPTTPIEKARTTQMLQTVDLKNVPKTVTRSPRPSIINKTVNKDQIPAVSTTTTVTVTKSSVSEAKSILTNSSKLQANTIVKLINAKTLTSSDAVKGAKTIAQISPQQIVVIKQPQSDAGATVSSTSPDRKKTIMLKQLQQQQTVDHQQCNPLENLRKYPQRILTKDQLSAITNIPSTSNLITNRVEMATTINSTVKQNSLEKQKQLQQLLVKHQNELKLQQNISVDLQQSKVLPKQMIVVKQNQGQIVAETQSPISEEETSGGQKIFTSPVIILNKQQYQQQLQNNKHQFIQLPSGQQLTTQQLQLLLKQQQQQALKRAQQQQIVMLKPELQTSQGQQQQIVNVMLKHQPTRQQQQHPQQQLVMIKQNPVRQQQVQKIPQKQPQSQVIQIANSARLMTPITSDFSEVTRTASVPRMQKIPMSAPNVVAPNTKTVNASGTAISVSVSKPSMPTYTVVTVGQQQKVFPQNNQHLQILASSSNAAGNSQTVVLPTTSGGLTLLQQTPMQQVLLPAGFNSPNMINFKSLQGLKVIPISTQSTAALRGQPVITRFINSNTVRPLLIQEDRTTPNTGSTKNLS